MASDFLRKVGGFLDNRAGMAPEQGGDAAGDLIICIDAVADRRQFFAVLCRDYGLPGQVREEITQVLQARDRS